MLTTPGIGILDRFELNAINRTGTALTVGGVYALDITKTDGNSTDMTTSLGNVVQAVTANLRGFLVVALGATAAAASGRFLLYGPCKILSDGSGTALTAGCRLIPQNASNQVIIQPATSLFNNVGVGFTANSLASTLIDAYFDGRTYDGEKAAS